MSDERNYKDTLSITRTDFPQKASLPTTEPERLAQWREIGLDQLIARRRADAPRYVLHDGPPYANGDIHLGHALNKCLKDIVVRYRTMAGYKARYVPGFDCHGLPIEQKIIEKLGKKEGSHSKPEIRRQCHEYAQRFIGLQTEQFQRLGVGGVWDKPYLTLDPAYEVGILSALRDMVAGGCVYRGFKPVYWDARFRTALAEAEIEYHEHTSPSIYVRFPVLNPDAKPELAGEGPVEIVIWTTTPWTLPGNLAVTLHPDLDYVLFESGGRKIVAAQGRLEQFVADAGLEPPRIIRRFKGAALEGLDCAHPLLDKKSRVILGDHVTLEQGTGCVHTAPGHGVEDFEVCRRYGIDVFVPVDDRGCYNDLYPDMQGVFVQKANPMVIERLKEKGLLVAQGEVSHQYPYSWRSREPVIIRATDQWFMNVDHDDIRRKCLNVIDNEVQWYPAWGRDRIHNMMATRPDWCLSRQRSWGVPIPALRSLDANQSILAVEVIERFMELVAEHGTDCWFTMPVEAFVPEGFKCPISGGTRFEKDNDILDVWFDSGSSHIAVLEQDEQLGAPADLYLEGSDQHRGWFMSSLTVSMAARNRAPYKAVLTHGFTLDAQGQPMSKSLGNVISPLEIIDRMGADVLRLWVVSEDYRSDVVASDDVFKQMSETYRRIRNTLRFLLGNLTDFRPGDHTVPPERRTEIDRWALHETARLVDRSRRAYEDFEFHRIYHAVNQYCVVTLSARYLDILKDRLYCSGPDDEIRRAAQSTLYDIFHVLCTVLAPIMPFTTDEAYSYGPAPLESVHLEDFPQVSDTWRDEALDEKWEELLKVRDLVNLHLETARRDKQVGKSLDAAVVLKPYNRDMLARLQNNGDLLREIFIVSQCTVNPDGATEERKGAVEETIDVAVSRADGDKCVRCWSWSTELGTDTDHPQLCPRCTAVVKRIDENG